MEQKPLYACTKIDISHDMAKENWKLIPFSGDVSWEFLLTKKQVQSLIETLTAKIK